MEQPNTQLLREIILHTEALFKQSYARPPIQTDQHTAAYPDMRIDATIASALEATYAEMLARDWYLAADAKGQQRLDDHIMIDELEGVDIRARLKLALLALERGFAVEEITWKYQKGRYALTELADINPDQIGFNVDDQMRMQSVVSIPIGGSEMTLPMSKVWLHRHNPSRRYPAGQSILEAAYRPWYAKDQMLKLWGLQLQKFGMPLFIFQIPDSLGQSTTMALRDAIYNLRVDGVATIPDSVAYQKLDPVPNLGLAFESAIEYHNAEIKRAIRLETNDPAASARSASQGPLLAEQSKTTRYGLTLWAWELCGTFRNQIIAPLIRANLGPDAPVPYLHLEGMTNTDPDAETLRIGNQATPQAASIPGGGAQP
jgi:hypothetical protein